MQPEIPVLEMFIIELCPMVTVFEGPVVCLCLLAAR